MPTKAALAAQRMNRAIVSLSVGMPALRALTLVAAHGEDPVAVGARSS